MCTDSHNEYWAPEMYGELCGKEGDTTYSSDDDDLEEEKDCNLLTQWTWPAKEASCQLAQWLDLLWTWPAKKDALSQTTHCSPSHPTPITNHSLTKNIHTLF